MAGFVILGMLAAFGALCAIWILAGTLLPRPKGGVLVYTARGQEERILRRYCWLRDLGLLRCPLVLLDSRLPESRHQKIKEKCHSVFFYTKDQWIEEIENIDGTGNPARGHRCGGLPKL